MIKLTYDQVLKLQPCSRNKIPDFGRRKYLTAEQALDKGVSVDDLLWVAGKLGRKDLCVRFALECAQRVSHNNTDIRVSKALRAVQAWLDSPSKSAAWSARSAAEAAEAAESAESAARYAARSAAWSARSAAESARSAAWSARSAAWSARSAAESAGFARSATWSATWSAARSAEELEQRKIFIRIFS